MGPAAGSSCEPAAGGLARVVLVVAASCREVVVGCLACPSDSLVRVVLGPAAAAGLSCVLVRCWPKLSSAAAAAAQSLCCAWAGAEGAALEACGT